MKKLGCILLLCLLGTLTQLSSAQDRKSTNEIAEKSPLFDDARPLAIKLRFATKTLKKNTNDSTYIISSLSYRKEDSAWDSLDIKLRVRGHYRLNNCYYVPLKLKFQKNSIRGTVFQDNHKLKLVLPCLLDKDNNDLVLKEFLAYQLFEVISPYHFKTRLVTLEFSEEKGKRIKSHVLNAFFIEDIDRVSWRHGGSTVSRNVHPLQQDNLASLQNALFQFMIGNTDFSTRGQHNEKLLYAQNKYISLPYDFDMSGLVNASYATISGMENIDGSIDLVTQRVYKGYKRDEVLLQRVRQDYIGAKAQLFEALEGLREYFQMPGQYVAARDYLDEFFRVLENDRKFQKQIVERARIR